MFGISGSDILYCKFSSKPPSLYRIHDVAHALRKAVRNSQTVFLLYTLHQEVDVKVDTCYLKVVK